MSDSPSEPSTELVHLEISDQVATVTLGRPRNRSARARRLVTGLFERLEGAGGGGAARAVVSRWSGRVFCSGADLSEASSQGMEEGAKEIVRLQRLLVTMGKPVVVEVGGPVRAGGIGIVAAADLPLAAQDATFALTEVKLGLGAAIISLTVHHRMNPRAASLSTLGGEVFSGTEAASYGLVTKAVPGDQLAGEVQALCASLATGAAQGLRESKRILNHDLLERIDTRGDEMAALSARLFASDEAREAMTAFLNRKK